MPGLFGVVSLDAGVSAAEDPRAIDAFERLASSLVHHRFDVVDRWRDPDGRLLVGRSGQPAHHTVTWPPPSASSGTVAPGSWIRFVAGSLEHPSAFHEPAPGPAEDRADDLLGARGAFAVLDHLPGSSETLIAADRRASYPLVHLVDGPFLFFGPELEAVLFASKTERGLDPAAAVSLLSHGHLLAGQTLQRNAHRLRGGEALLISGNGVRSHRWWQFAPGQSPSTATEEELEIALADQVRASVARQLEEPQRTMVFLSGGVDSRAVVASAAEAIAAGEVMSTVTWGVGDSPGSDVAIASELATQVHSRHRFMRRTLDGYQTQFETANRLIGSAADAAAFHPLEAAFMGRLREDGFVRVLRGDEAFGWSAGVSNLEEAFREVKIRPLDDLPAVRAVIRGDLLEEWGAAGTAALDGAGEEVRGWSPNAAKDYLYFNHRLQGYLGPAGYYKLAWLDHHNPLLDDVLLDFMAGIPDQLRIDKLLFRRAMERAFPDLWRIPIAHATNLEDWPAVLAADTPARDFLVRALGRSDSRLWDVLDRAAIVALVGQVTGAGTEAGAAGRPLRSRVLARMPLGVRRRWTRYRGSQRVLRTPPHVVVMRAMVLQQFVDGVMTGPMELPPLERADSPG